MTSTHEIATTIINNLKDGLSSVKKTDIANVRSIFLTGSYVRGDWHEASSDLDINVLFRPTGVSDDERQGDMSFIRSLIPETLLKTGFPSQCPGGIDWGVNSYIPKTAEDVSSPSRYPYFGVFYFDFLQNLEILWGENIRITLPPVNDPRSLALPSLEFSLDGINRIREDDPHVFKAAFIAYKAALIAQIFFGKVTIDKTRILELYRRYVPNLKAKVQGEDIILNYIGSRYPDQMPSYKHKGYYVEYISAVIQLIRENQD